MKKILAMVLALCMMLPAMALAQTPGTYTAEAKGFSSDVKVTVTLTETGRTIAEKIFERHRVLSRLLMKLGVSEETATADACKMEHAISDESFEAIKRYTADLIQE